jgi:tRNA(Ile)-lysidine synthase
MTLLFDSFSKEFEQILSEFASEKTIAISLSGGVDSIVLLSLAIIWAKSNSKKIIALTIDHKLREESSAEAKQVFEYCQSLGIDHRILVWEHDIIDTNIQEKAREARYKLISNWCKANSVSIVLTAHHLGDQLEQLLISISQGSGVYSFNIPRINKINGINFLRPLLKISKDELIEYAISNNLKWWEDKTNSQDKYLRNRVRPLAESLLKISDKKRVITSFANIERASRALSCMALDFIKNHVTLSDMGYAKFDTKEFLLLEDEIKFSIIRHLVIIIGRRDSEIRLDSIMAVNEAIESKSPKTLAGCEFLFSSDKCVIIREFGRVMPDDFKGKEGTWDGRFKIVSNKDIIVSYAKIEAINNLLKEKPELLDFDKDLQKNIRKKIILTLPCIFELEKFIAIPHIYNYDCKVHIELIDGKK